MDEVLDLVHAGACATSAFKPAAVRVRAYATTKYRIADLHADNAFIHVHARIASGRSEETRRALGEAIFKQLVARLEPLFASMTLGISMEVSEIHPVCSWRTGNLHENVSARAAQKNN